jgi:predicted Zn-dependent protease
MHYTYPYICLNAYNNTSNISGKELLMVYYRYPNFYPYKTKSEVTSVYQKDMNGFWQLEESYFRANEKAELEEQKISPEEFKLVYPYVDNFNEDIRKKVNAAITDTEAVLFKDNILIASAIDFKTIVSNYNVQLNQKGLLSILFELYYYTGGAHGNTVFDSLSIDLNTGEVYKFNDLFNPKHNYIPGLNEIAIKKATESGVPLLNEYKGLTEDQKFYLTPSSIVLYYQLYEYTPYAYGRFEIKIPYKEIQHLLYPLSPIKKLL